MSASKGSTGGGSIVDILAHLNQYRGFNPIPHPVRAFLKDDGGESNITGDYSVATGVGETEFFYQAPAERVVFLNEMIGFVLDATVTWANEKYGAITLANGFSFKVMDGDTLIHDINAGVPIRSNADASAHCFNSDYPVITTGTVDARTMRFDFARAGAPVLLKAGWRLVMTASDKMDGLDQHSWKVIGDMYQIDVEGRVQPPVGQP